MLEREEGVVLLGFFYDIVQIFFEQNQGFHNRAFTGAVGSGQKGYRSKWYNRFLLSECLEVTDAVYSIHLTSKRVMSKIKVENAFMAPAGLDP